MTKEKAIEFIQNSDYTDFSVTPIAKRLCDLCGKPKSRDFKIECKKIFGAVSLGYEFKKIKGSRITKHICTDCFVKLFPDSVEQ